MNKKLFASLISLILVFGVLSSAAVLAAVSVGVNEGDWIEYNCTYTVSPPDNYPKSVRIDVKSIEGTTITVDFFEEELDGKNGTITDSFDLESGAPSLLLIPANLDVGDEFDHRACRDCHFRGFG